MKHIPVLLEEVLKFLDPKPSEKFIDATFGAGGHSKAVLGKLGQDGSLLGIDANLDAVKSEHSGKPQLKLVHGNFRDIAAIASENGFESVNGILIDLGLSSDILDDPSRGFSFQTTGPLDMRFDQSQEKTADGIVNLASEKELVKIYREYSEEKFSQRIARAIVEKRSFARLETTTDLFELIKAALPEKFRWRAADSARRVFQALRIEVNQELQALKEALPQAFELLKPHGRLAVISFHSLEDRIVKRTFLEWARGCICPPDFPQCVCGKEPLAKILTKKPLIAAEAEIALNSRAKSAKMRVIEKL